ncbi:uncharacterized protein [Atheta coriaria]|uniref:uncharacterized protein isoform X2 n=1 Tax=Dalotia coriaria TaxID=877792 RepID=UPI0031F42985
MDFYNLFKGFFGIPNSVPPREFRQNEQPQEDPSWSSFMGSPHEFHKFVEEQMQHIMSSFGMGRHVTPFDDFNTQETPPGSLREQYLKPGFDHPSTSKADTDLDGRVSIDELDTVLKPSGEMQPYTKPIIKGGMHFFGQSISTRTVRKPDGSVETTRTVTDNAGNRETTVTMRDKNTERTITTRIDANGDETKEEKFVNLLD